MSRHQTAEIPISLAGLLSLAGPVVMTRLGIMTMGLVDSVVVGRHSASDLAYLTLAWAPTGVVLVTAFGLLSGVQVMTSQAIGDGRAEDTGAILRRGFVYGFWLGVGCVVILGGLGGWALHHIGIEPSLADGAAPVLHVLAWSMLPILVLDAGVMWLEAHGRATPVTIATWGANLVNLAANLWLVPGDSGLPVEGAVASAWATLGSRVAMLAFIAAAILAWPAARRLGVLAPAPRDPEAAEAMRRVGYGASISSFVEAAAFSSMAVVAGWIGTLAVATWGIVINVMAIIFMVPLGLATATGVLVGRAYGAGDPAGVRRAGTLGIGAATAATIAICAGIALFADLVAGAYTRDPGVREAAGYALLLACFFFTLDGLQVVGAQACRAQGDVWVPSLTHTISYVGVMIPLAYALALPLGYDVAGIVMAATVATLFAAGFLIARFYWLTRSPALTQPV